MLILQRKKGQALKIGDSITIRVTEIGADSVRLAIEAPREISVLREELEETARANQEAAREGSASDLAWLVKNFGK